MKLTLYTIGCPNCVVLEAKLRASNLDFDIVEDVEEMKKLHMLSTPMLQIDNEKPMTFKQALDWLKTLEVNK